MSKRGKRSQNGKQKQIKRLKKLEEQERQKTEYQIAARIVLDYSWQDQVTGEKVFTEEMCKDKHGNVFTFKVMLEKKLIAKFGCVPQHALNHELGESLNRFEWQT